MIEYKVISRKPAPRKTSDKYNWTPCMGEKACIDEIIKSGIGSVKKILKRKSDGKWGVLNGLEYLRLWQQWSVRRKTSN